MPLERWTTAQVTALAPDASSLKGARSVSGASHWPASGVTDAVLFGLCRGSGKNPYQVAVDLAAPAYKCTCPSRKFPCKHALGLLLLWAEGQVTDAEPPAWVTEWQAARAARAAAPPRAGGTADPVAAAKRAQQRGERVAAGVTELRQWLDDQVQQGLAGAGTAGHRPFDAMAARLVDAQAPAAASAVRRLGAIAGIGPHWADRMLGELGLLRLLVTAYDRIDALPPALAATVRTRIGFPVSAEDVLAGPRVRDRWQVLGQVDTDDGALMTRRIWLHGADTGRFALVLTFAAPGQTLGSDLVPGTELDADLCFYPGALPLRALVAERHGTPAPLTAPAGAVPLRAALGGWASTLAAEPWRYDTPVLLSGVVPSADGWLVDAAGEALPLAPGHREPWWLLAAAGGEPAVLAAEYSPSGLRPLAAWVGGRYVPAGPAVPDATAGRGPELPSELLAAALVGTARRPWTATTVTVGGHTLTLDTAATPPPARGGSHAFLEDAARPALVALDPSLSSGGSPSPENGSLGASTDSEPTASGWRPGEREPAGPPAPEADRSRQPEPTPPRRGAESGEGDLGADGPGPGGQGQEGQKLGEPSRGGPGPKGTDATGLDVGRTGKAGPGGSGPDALRPSPAGPDGVGPDTAGPGGRERSASGLLLEAVAAAVVYRRAGVTPAAGRVPVAAAPGESEPALPWAAGARLLRILREGGTPGGAQVAQELLAQWLAAAAAHGGFVPPEALPALFEAGRRNTAIRPALGLVCGRRGAWLAGMRNDWAWLLDEMPGSDVPDDPALWTAGTGGERVAFLARLRRDDPGAARELVARSWAAEAPDERVRFLGVFEDGLSGADDAFLDSALDDRRKEVREAALDLVRRLPGSALGARMAVRARAAVRLERRTFGRDRLIVDPPAELDPGLRRDGVGATPARGAGISAWLLEEIVAGTPLGVWTADLDRGPDAVLDLARGHDWETPLLHGWAKAAITQQDAAWASALVANDAHNKAAGLREAVRWDLHLLLPPAELAHIAADFLRREDHLANRLLAIHTGDWPDELAVTVVETIARRARTDRHSWQLAELCRAAAMAMPPRYAPHLDRLAAQLDQEPADPSRVRPVADLARTLTFRHEMLQEFA